MKSGITFVDGIVVWSISVIYSPSLDPVEKFCTKEASTCAFIDEPALIMCKALMRCRYLHDPILYPSSEACEVFRIFYPDFMAI